MLLEKLRRLLAALICAVSAGAILAAACVLCKLLDRHAETLIGPKQRLPALTILFEHLIPDPGRLLDFGLLVFVVGYGCLGWTQRPTALHTMFHAVSGVLAASIFTTGVAFMFINLGIDEEPPPPAWWSLPWITFCGTPLVMASFSWWRQWRSRVSSNPP